MRIRPTTALLVLASVAALAAPARADAPDSDIVGMDNTATGGPRVELNIDKPAGRQTAWRRTRRLTEHRRNRRVASEVAVHNDGFNAVPGDSQASPSSSEASSSSRVVAEARRWIGTNPTGRASLWCARFMNFVLERVGLSGTSSDMAKSFASYGHRLSEPKVGAIAVMNRGRSGGHVGVVSGFNSHGDPIIISGNYSRHVAEAVYSRSQIYAYVAPDE